ncbi:TetR/AcrR family transcriptional regulator [Hymenobacter properus]|uniref:TetR/AcrR family transcriptional regulator n=1 Tax=Hymenobacter properus TaxID=2791026 RepID=A0A931BC81_9BACT|nr:TetR/AcrR family transcriptional regulator [Hymenobacter properus]MBF9141114.1 TetR/AcrR family transcriptional regulator [Hymenobacter properus]MBR7719923.1 TetR/AcrR family transcriptional regulator [Microvirga sp. SRT04]
MSKAERTRQFIIEQTAPVFNKQGYAGTSLNDLTAATGLTKGAIYGNFENKEEVALAAFDYNLELVQQPLRAGAASGSTVREKLLAMPRYYRNAYPTLKLRGGCPILNAAVECDDAPPSALLLRVQDSFAKWHRNLMHLIEKGQATGEVRSSVDASHYANLFIALTEGGILVSKATGSSTALFASLNHIEHLIENELVA